MDVIKQEWQAGGKGGNKWFPETAPQQVKGKPKIGFAGHGAFIADPQQGKASKGKPKKKK